MSVVKLGSNISSLNVQRNLSDNTSALSKSLERLSSGLRINRAADDAAGLAISQTLSSDRRVFNQGVRNLNDGLSLLNIADSVVGGLTNIVTRLKELAEQSANGVLSDKQRVALNQEAQALSDEYFRISSSAKFNGKYILNGSLGELRLQGGFGIDGSILSTLGGAIGDGTFSTFTTSTDAALDNSVMVKSGDLNGDGLQDIASIESGGHGTVTVTVQFAQGDGSFSAAQTYAMFGGSGNALDLKDVNNDGVLDIIAAGDIGAGTGFAVRLGNGDGTFSNSQQFNVTLNTLSAMAIGDLNGDGNLDVVLGGSFGVNGRVTINLGNGDGTFGSATTMAAGTSAVQEIGLGDLDGDGKLDLVVTGSAFAPIWFQGNGQGGFGTSTSVADWSMNNYNSVQIADFNGDGIADIALGGRSGAVGAVRIAYGSGNGTFSASTSYQMHTSSLLAFELGDVNGDGILDLISSGNNGVATRMGVGDGTFGAATTYTAHTVNPRMTLLDANQDGVLDVFAAGGNAGGRMLDVILGDAVAGAGPLLPFSLGTKADARQALGLLDQKLKQLGIQRATIGAFQSRIGFATNNLTTASENYAAAASRITDVDVADEAARVVRLGILQKAASSILAQANQQPALALTLLSLEENRSSKNLL